MVDKGNLQAFRALVVVAVVEALNVEQHGETIVLASFCTLEKKHVQTVNLHNRIKRLVFEGIPRVAFSCTIQMCHIVVSLQYISIIYFFKSEFRSEPGRRIWK